MGVAPGRTSPQTRLPGGQSYSVFLVNNPAASRERLSKVCLLCRSSRGRKSSCGRHPWREAAIAGGPGGGGARPGNGIRGRWWLRVDQVVAESRSGCRKCLEPSAPSCRLNTPALPSRLPTHRCLSRGFCGCVGAVDTGGELASELAAQRQETEE